MSWTYEASALQDTTAGLFTGSTVGVRTQIRFLIQDNQPTRQLLQNEEIDWIQTQEDNVYTMAAACCESLVTRAGAVKMKQIDDFKIIYDVAFYRGLALTLRARGAGNQIPYAGGISIGDKMIDQLNSDAVQPSFSRGMEENPLAPRPSLGRLSNTTTSLDQI